MKYLDTIDKKQLKEVLIKSWITHDAMWVYHTAREFGMERTNTINIFKLIFFQKAGIQWRWLEY